MLADIDIKNIVFDTIESIDNIILDTNVDGILPFHSLWDAVISYGGSAMGSAIQQHMLLLLNKKYPGKWRLGTGKEPDIVNIASADDSFELKSTLARQIIGNKTSGTTVRKLGNSNFVFVYVDKESGEVAKIAVAVLSPDDWIKQGGDNVQVAKPNPDKVRIIYEGMD